MEKVINSNSTCFGKNKRRSTYYLTPQDQLNHRVAVVFMKGDMFPRIQILPEMWFLFSINVDRTVCGNILSMVTIPERWDAKSYWNDVFCSICIKIWAIIHSNYMIAVFNVFIGKVMYLYQMLVLFYLN